MLHNIPMANPDVVTQGRGAKPSALGLRTFNLLAGMQDDALEALAQQCRWRIFPAGRRVTSRDSQDRDVYLIVSGKVRITAYSLGGRQVTYRDIEAGDWFGDLAAIDGLSRSADVDAIEEAVLASMTPAQFMGLLYEQPVVCERVLRRLVALVRDLTERVFEFSTLGVQNRVQVELLRLAKEAGVQDNRARLDPAPKHAEIASKVGSYREQITRELSAMTKQGLLQRTEDGVLVINDVARLERIVAEVRRST
jgi:CRP-like cAMP-binding protein